MDQTQPRSTDESSYRINYEEELNPAQLEAVLTREGPLLVIAGAGSGKTRTLTYRVARLVESGVQPWEILLLTFTRKAAQEMLKRASELLDRRCEKVAGGTFHSFANLILRRYGGAIGLENNFAIIDRPDAESLIGMLRKEAGRDAKARTFPKKGTLMNIFSKAVNKAEPIEEIVYEEYPQFESDMETICAIGQAYPRRKAENNFLDYDDLLVFLKRLLNDHPDVRQRISSTYRFIMVDEYQDTNPIQAEIVKLLSESHKNIMVVGDDSQSIYAFRGANFKNIMRFPKLFEGAKVITLEENYRSVQPILSLTNVIIERASEKFSKKLFTRITGGSTPVLVNAKNENAQSRFVVRKIESLQREGVPLNEIAVLFRASFHSFDLEIELGRAGIQFIKVGGFKFMESAHIKDVLAHMRVISHPDDRLSWYRLLLLLEKIGPKTAENIYDAIAAHGGGCAGLASAPLKPAQDQKMQRLKEFYSGIDADAFSVAELGRAVIDYYKPILEVRYDDHPKRLRDLEHLVTIMERYEDLGVFLTDMTLEPPNTSLSGALYTAEDVKSDRLTLSTVHSAKGLEWHTVFIIWTLDGRFPSSRAMDSQKDLDEERRLMYVAATRARQNLFFTYPEGVYDAGSYTFLSRPSRFIDYIPDDILEKEAPRF
ncbi:MAG: ATP-dependent helicase [Desulfobacterales bacterium]|nr:ATP-dependent helicase [Desulfobacterales bacterium]